MVEDRVLLVTLQVLELLMLVGAVGDLTQVVVQVGQAEQVVAVTDLRLVVILLQQGAQTQAGEGAAVGLVI
jgi:hypothetical protein